MKRVFICIFCICFMHNLFGQEANYVNPILPGSYPDPSICKVGDTFYLVNSSFEYFPGLPIHKSTDLVNWELIGYGLHREDQCKTAVNLVDVQSNGGIHAPSIRFNNGTYYIITTNVYYHEDLKKTDFVNFILTAKDPAGPWSDPIVIAGAPGIDPDIFFDEDGKVWYTGTRMPDDPSFNGEGQIWMQELDPETYQLVGEEYLLWRGACGGVWAEGPHIYKKDGFYYLMIAEGGTSFNHAVMIAVSDKITGPYIPNDRNPIFTARHLSYDHWVHSIGHADLIEVDSGRWYMVSLGVRGDLERGSNMGRETHLFPVDWEQEPFEWKQNRYWWPVVSKVSGRPERIYESPYGKVQTKHNYADDFSGSELNDAWNFRRVPKQGMYQLDQMENVLRVYGDYGLPVERQQASWLGIRQTESDFSFSFNMEIESDLKDVSAGLCFVQKDDNFLFWNISKQGGQSSLELLLKMPGEEEKILKTMKLNDFQGQVCFKLESASDEYNLSYSLDGEQFEDWFSVEANMLLSKGYTGAYLGFSVVGKGAFVEFDNVIYEPLVRN